MFKGKNGGKYLLGARNCSTLQLFDLLETITGVARPAISVPGWAAQSGAVMLDWVNRNIRGSYDPSVDPVRAEMGCHFWNLSSKAARIDLGFSPRRPEDTIRDTVKFIREMKPELQRSKL
jgi:hypothetical protein